MKWQNQTSRQTTYTILLCGTFSLEEQCTGVHLKWLQHPCSNESPIHNRSWVLLEVWSNVVHHRSWSTPIYLKKEVQTIGQVASDMTSLLLTCYFRAVYGSGILCSGQRASSQSCHISACRCSYIHEYNLSVVCMLCSGISVSPMHQWALAASSGQTCSFDSFHL